MRKLLVLLALGLAIPAVAATDDEQEAAMALAFVCNNLNLDCRRALIKPPTIIRTRLLNSFRLYGAYVPGEGRVYIAKDAPRHTVVHEVTHYVLDVMNTGVNRCESEEIARLIHHKYEGSPYDDSWRTRYRCPKIG